MTSLRRAELGDIQQLEDIRLSSISVLAEYYSQAQIKVWKSLRPDWEELYKYTYIYSSYNEVAGFITVTNTELKLLYISPEFQSRGIGSFLVSKFELKSMTCDANFLTEKILLSRGWSFVKENHKICSGVSFCNKIYKKV